MHPALAGSKPGPTDRVDLSLGSVQPGQVAVGVSLRATEQGGTRLSVVPVVDSRGERLGGQLVLPEQETHLPFLVEGRPCRVLVA